MKNEKEILKKLEEIKGLIKKDKPAIKWTKIGDLEWSEDLGLMDWFQATKKCKKLGGRLPTRMELMDLYDNHGEECKNFALCYWSSTENSHTYAWYQNFATGNLDLYNKNRSYYIRCVRAAVSEKLNN